ncbi:MAG: hypothetical protein H6719_36595 [Sandaracinaceae bacterium]|nr:hypothetical protein [Sandaracinaceae bacterium]
MPWHVFTSPIAQWSALPSFLVGEYLFIALAVALLVHAVRSGRAHVLIWVGALLAGTANDLIFMALPLVDNFWHGQATIMLTARLPLYIPCVYVSFMYVPAVAARRLGLPLWSSAPLTGLLAVLFYAPFDITGAKHLWWTWHDTDLPVAARILGAPASSTLWVLTFAASFALLVEWVIRRDPEVSGLTFAKGLAAVAGLTTIVMVLQMTVLQQLDGGAPGYVALGVGVGVYAVAAALGARKAKPTDPRPVDRLANGGVVVYYLGLIAVMALADPASHRSTGVHQEVGECYVEATDVTGLTRYQYLCAADFDEDFSFACVDEPPADGTTWYTICGRPHTAFGRWMGGVLGLGLLGSLVYSWLFGGLRLSRRE